MALNLTIRVKAAINKNIISLDKDLSVKSAIKLMVRKNVGSVVIMGERSKPIGIVTERDILKSIAYHRTNPETKVEGIMSKPLISLDATILSIPRNLTIQMRKQRPYYSSQAKSKLSSLLPLPTWQ